MSFINAALEAAALGGAWERGLRTFYYVPLPKILIIENKRLGLLFRLLQFGTIVLTILYLVASKPWLMDFVPVQKGVAVWREAPDKAAKANEDVPHCNDLASYVYHYSNTWTYNPTSCKALPPGDSFRKEGRSLYYPTYVKDESSWQGTGGDCDGAAASSCATAGGTFKRLGEHCECASSESYFTLNPEEEKFVFLHGYEVSTKADSSRFQSAYSVSDVVEEGERTGSDKGNFEQPMLTILQSQDGTECKVDGKSTYTTVDGRLGISGTLREWMACAGVDLDTKSDKTRSFDPGENMEPHLRTTGLVLDLELNYKDRHNHNIYAHSGVVCYVKVRAIPVWNSRTEMAYTELPSPTRRRTAYRYRYSQGITVQIHTSGSFGFFDLPKLLTGIVSVIVLSSIPTLIIQFVAIFLLGILSDIYNNAQRQVLNISKAFHGITARMMMSSCVFRGLSNQWHLRSKEMKGLQLVDFRYHMREIFAREMKENILNGAELDRLAGVVYHGLDIEGDMDEGVCFDEFVHACSDNEVLSMKHVAAFFDFDRRRGLLERLLDDTIRDAPKTFRSMTRGFSFDLDDNETGLDVCMGTPRAMSAATFPESIVGHGEEKVNERWNSFSTASGSSQDIPRESTPGDHVAFPSPPVVCPSCKCFMRFSADTSRGCQSDRQRATVSRRCSGDDCGAHRWSCVQCRVDVCARCYFAPRGGGVESDGRTADPEGVNAESNACGTRDVEQVNGDCGCSDHHDHDQAIRLIFM